MKSFEQESSIFKYYQKLVCGGFKMTIKELKNDKEYCFYCKMKKRKILNERKIEVSACLILKLEIYKDDPNIKREIESKLKAVTKINKIGQQY